MKPVEIWRGEATAIGRDGLPKSWMARVVHNDIGVKCEVCIPDAMAAPSWRPASSGGSETGDQQIAILKAAVVTLAEKLGID